MNRWRHGSWRFYLGVALALAIGALAILLVTKLAGRRIQPEKGAAGRPVDKHAAPPPKPGLPGQAENAPAAGGPQVFVPNASAKNAGKPPGIPSLPAAATPLPSAVGPSPDSTAAVASPAPAVSVPPEDPAVTLLSVGLGEEEKKSVKEALSNFPSLYDSKTLMSMLFRAHAEDWRQRSEDRLKSAAWPEHLAEQCAEEIKAYLRPGFLSRNGEFSLLQDETFANYHVRRAVMREFNEMVYRSDQRNIARHPEAVGRETPLGKALQVKAAYLRQHQPVFFQYTDWPEQLTELCLKEVE